MPFVQRTAAGTVNGCYAQRQPDYAEEFLADDHPEVVAFLNQAALPDNTKALEQSRKQALREELSKAIDSIAVEQQAPFRLLLQLMDKG